VSVDDACCVGGRECASRGQRRGRQEEGDRTARFSDGLRTIRMHTGYPPVRPCSPMQPQPSGSERGGEALERAWLGDREAYGGSLIEAQALDTVPLDGNEHLATAHTCTGY
jgi:hypothetical protein